MTDETDLSAARNEVWDCMSDAPLRRALLGRDRCDALVRIAAHVLPAAEMFAAGLGTESDHRLRRRTERRVADLYSERCGFAFTTFVLWWAISTIVELLVIRWWRRHHPAALYVTGVPEW